MLATEPKPKRKPENSRMEGRLVVFLLYYQDLFILLPYDTESIETVVHEKYTQMENVLHYFIVKQTQ